MATQRRIEADTVAVGHEALGRGAWHQAKERFEAALAEEETGEGWEGLGWVGWWLSDAELTVRARERAYRAYRSEGDAGSAARVAAWLAADFREFRGEEAVGRGWLERARRLVEGLPDSADHGWVTLTEGDFALHAGDAEEAARLATVTARLGREHGVVDLEALGLAMEGIALVVRGRVAEGMRLLDEASAIAAGEDIQLPLSRGWALCYLISACEGVGDFSRAAEWCAVSQAFAERWGARQLLGVCRSAYGRVLATSGDWAAAELELTGALADLEASRPGMAGGGLVRLAELRARQGRADEARALFERAAPHPLALIGLGRLALDAGDAAAAADAAERVLRRLPESGLLDRLPALELLVGARAALSDAAAAGTAQRQLDEAAAVIGTPYLRGRAWLSAGELALAEGEHEEARRACEDAVDCFREVSAPYETAAARLVLARALAGLGREEPARLEAEGAMEAFAKLGAARDAERAQLVLRGEGGPTGAVDGSLLVPRAASAATWVRELTARELEVLRLVARGLSDAEIAAQLVLSPHTVHRHVANVRTKLRLPSRAAAVAYAARAGLL